MRKNKIIFFISYFIIYYIITFISFLLVMGIIKLFSSAITITMIQAGAFFLAVFSFYNTYIKIKKDNNYFRKGENNET